MILGLKKNKFRDLESQEFLFLQGTCFKLGTSPGDLCKDSKTAEPTVGTFASQIIFQE